MDKRIVSIGKLVDKQQNKAGIDFGNSTSQKEDHGLMTRQQLGNVKNDSSKGYLETENKLLTQWLQDELKNRPLLTKLEKDIERVFGAIFGFIVGMLSGFTLWGL